LSAYALAAPRYVYRRLALMRVAQPMLMSSGCPQPTWGAGQLPCLL